MIWPPQNTGLFAPPACSTCCAAGPPPEADAEVHFVDIYPFLFGLSYEIIFTPQARDSETGIVGTGVIRFTIQSAGPLPDCSGCSGPQCLDEDGNPIPPYYGSADGWLETTETYDVEYYITSDAEHGTATDLVFTTGWAHNLTFATNMPDCTPFEQIFDTISGTLVW